MNIKLNIMIVLAALCVSLAGYAAEYTQEGTISYVESGWFGEGLAIGFDHPSSNCPQGSGHFGIEKSHPGFTEMTSIALAAFAANLKVQLRIEPGQCVLSRTKVIAIKLIKE